jgi:hypothetical protein
MTCPSIDAADLKRLIEAEVVWAQANQALVENQPPEFVAGYIAGLRQSFHLALQSALTESFSGR